MMEIMIVFYIIGVLAVYLIFYNLVKSAVKEGTLEALIEHERIRSKLNKEE